MWRSMARTVAVVDVAKYGYFIIGFALDVDVQVVIKYRDKSFRTGAVLHQKCPFSHNQKPLFTSRKKIVPFTDVLES